MRPAFVVPSLLLSLLLPLACRRDEPIREPVDVHESDQDRIVRLAGELRRLGFSLDLGPLTVETRPPQGMNEVVSTYLTITRKPNLFEGLAQLRRALGIPPVTTAAATRKGVIMMLAANARAGYLPARKGVVLRDDALSLDTADAELLRVLALAYLDQALGGLTTTVLDAESSTDNGLVRQCLVEGFANYVSATVLGAREQRPAELAVEPAALLATVASTDCRPGVQFVAARYQEGGWKAVLAALAKPPTSTEELLHPEKLNTDFPASLQLPAWPDDAGEAELVYDDTLGELAIERILREGGLDDIEATRAAVGWDGDRIRLWQAPSGEKVVVWRTAWDREEDAEQFIAAIKPKVRDVYAFRVERRGRLVDAVSTESEAVAAQWREVLAAEGEQPLLEPMDAVTTAKVEAGPVPESR